GVHQHPGVYASFSGSTQAKASPDPGFVAALARFPAAKCSTAGRDAETRIETFATTEIAVGKSSWAKPPTRPSCALGRSRARDRDGHPVPRPKRHPTPPGWWRALRAYARPSVLSHLSA